LHHNMFGYVAKVKRFLGLIETIKNFKTPLILAHTLIFTGYPHH
jgi:hypothetical protein